MTTENNKLPVLVNLSAIRLSDAELPVARVPIMMLGTFWKGRQKITLTRDDVKAMSENFRKRGNGEVVIDYEHASQNPEVAQGGAVPAAGWVKQIDEEPGGEAEWPGMSAEDLRRTVWGTAEFTRKAADMIAASEYKYLSPAGEWGARDKTTGKQQGFTLTSVALTNTPVLDRMPAIRLSEGWINEEEGARQMKEKMMCSEHPNTAMLCPDCDASEIKKLAASEHEHGRPRVLQLSEVSRKDGRMSFDGVPDETLVPLSVVRAIDAERVALSEVEGAVKAGKILPKQREHFEKIALSDIASFRGIVAEMKPQLDTEEHGHGGGGEGEGVDEISQIDVRLSEMAAKKSKEDGISYGAALKLVASENAPLVKRRAELQRGIKAQGEENE